MGRCPNFSHLLEQILKRGKKLEKTVLKGNIVIGVTETMLSRKVLCIRVSVVNCNVLQKSHEINCKVAMKSPVWKCQSKVKNTKPQNETPSMAAAHCRLTPLTQETR